LQILLDDVIVLIANFRIPQEHKILNFFKTII